MADFVIFELSCFVDLKKTFSIICVGTLCNMHAQHPRRPEEDAGPPGTGVTAVSCYRRQLEEASALIHGVISLSCRLLIKILQASHNEV